MDVGLTAFGELPVRGQEDGSLVPPSDPPLGAVNGNEQNRSDPAGSRDGDRAEFSKAAIDASQAVDGQSAKGEAGSDHQQNHDHHGPSGQATTKAANGEPAAAQGQQNAAGGEQLTEQEQKQVDQLKKRDAEVRRHEMAHKNAAGPYARGGPTYEYQRGPDGKRYAIGGSVQIDTSPIPGDPQATIQKMQVVQRAANAPAEPSAQDRKVAAQAARAAQKARQELREQQAQETKQTEHSDGAENPSLLPSERSGIDADKDGVETQGKSQEQGHLKPAGELVDTVA